uniref:Late nodulin domain-containing protein n=1 Tax=Medicago truncatula TaxID=3880 RepID=I3SZ60_MEDTR|nr:unknown [Medicago truncatula]
MQRRTNMTQTLIFIYALFIVVSLFLVVTCEARIPCVSRNDCPKRPYPLFMKCIDNFCEIWKIGKE